MATRGIFKLNLDIVTFFTRPLEALVGSVHKNTPRTSVPTIAATPTHCIVCWLVGAEDTVMSLCLHFVQLELSVYRHIRVSNLLYGVERVGAGDAICPSFKKLRGRRPDRLAQRPRLQQGAAGQHQQERRSR